MKRQLLLILFIFSCIYGFSQESYKIDYDTKKLEGTWVATSGNKSYEITFVKQMICFEKIDKNVSFEAIIGSIKYLDNNKVTKTVNTDGSNSSLIVYFRRPQEFTIHYREKENGKSISGRAIFEIKPDGKTARWYNLNDVNTWSDEPKKEKFDIPKELTFTKK